MAAPKKGAAPKAAPKPKAPAAPQAPLADAGSAAPGADQAGQDSQEGPQGAAPELAKGTVAVSVRPPLERFHRCGMRFTRSPVMLVVAELAEGVLERLQDEPRLVVQKG